jgi:hypothetical protein
MSALSRFGAIVLLTVIHGISPFGSSANATPWMSLHAGTPCQTCHVNTQGGGMRTEIGWGAGAYTGMVDWSKLSFDWLAERESNALVDDVLSIGWDIRSQSARIGQPSIRVDDQGRVESELADRSLFLMQLQPYMMVRPHEVLELYGTWAFAAGETISDRDGCVEPFAGQSCFEAMAIVHPAEDWTIRAGMLQPSVGLRHDDHTMLIREDVSRGPVLAANYAEPGGEVTYLPTYWLRADAGVFNARNLSEAIADPAQVTTNDVAISSRVTFQPVLGRSRNARFATQLGGSIYTAGAFRMENLFAGVGWLNRGSVLFESAWMQYSGGSGPTPTARNLSTQLNVQLWTWLIATSRAETGHARRNGDQFDTFAYAGGVQWFPLPFIEIRPEYRYESNDRFRTGQYTVQLHFFY